MSRATPLIVAFLLVLSMSVAAVADTVGGGQEGVTAQNDGRAAVDGPSSPGLLWTSEDIEDREWARERALSFDSEGHVLVQVDYRDETDTRVEALVAVNRSDGTIAWQLDGVDADCDVAADDGGMIYAQAQTNSQPTDLIAIDAATGTIAATKTYTPPDTPDEPIMHVCNDGLRLLDDGTIIVVERTGEIRAIDTTTTPMSALWYDTRESSQMLGRPPASPDGSTVYQVWVDNADPKQAHVDAIDAATGAVTATTTVPGDDSTISTGQGDAVLVDSRGGVVVSTTDTKGTGGGSDDTTHLTRLNPDLGEDWSVTIAADDPFYEDRNGFNSLVDAGSVLVGWYSGSHIVAVDPADGSPAWKLQPDSFTNNEGRIVADAAGNVYWSTFGGNSAQSADADGVLRWTLPECALGFGEALAVGPIDSDGTLYTIAVKQEGGAGAADNDLQVFAIQDGAPLPQGDCPESEERLSGQSRFDTAIEISQSAYPQDGSADVVLLARADVFADALAGTPLAVQENGPLLITPTDQLLPDVADEIERLLGSDTSKTVYLLGGTAALDSSVEASVDALGYETRRLSGADRIGTAIDIAEELDTIEAFLITTGYNFPDALAAGPAAAEAGGAVMLSFPDRRAPDTDDFMDARSSVPRYAIGGPAADAYPEATEISGPDRTATAVAVAEEFFDSPPAVGLARLDEFPDSLTGGGHIATGTPELARQGGPMLLTATDFLVDTVEGYLCANADSLQKVFVYGGIAAIEQSVADDAEARIQGTGC